MTTLLIEQQEAVLQEVPEIKSCSPQVDGSVQVAHGNRNWNTRWRGETPDYLAIKKWTVSEGRGFSMHDVEQSAGKVLLGQTVRQQLLGDSPAVGPKWERESYRSRPWDQCFSDTL